MTTCWTRIVGGLAAAAVGLSAGAASAGAVAPRGWLDPLRYRDVVARGADDVRHVEIVEMLSAIVRGRPMGPDEAWFHPARSRYGWKWLAGRCDANRDGVITRAEFKGPAELFDRLDREHRGSLTAADFDWSDRSPFVRHAELTEHWFGVIDRDKNGRISRAEWLESFERMAKGLGSITPDDLREGLFPPPAPGARGQDVPDQPSRLRLATSLLTGEVGSPFPGPAVGRKAPDFTLPTQDGTGEIRLSRYRGDRPAVLVFGSFT
jgi:hypothetical protein